MKRPASATISRRSGCATTGRPITRKDWVWIAALAAGAALVALMNIRAA